MWRFWHSHEITSVVLKFIIISFQCIKNQILFLFSYKFDLYNSRFVPYDHDQNFAMSILKNSVQNRKSHDTFWSIFFLHCCMKNTVNLSVSENSVHLWMLITSWMNKKAASLYLEKALLEKKKNDITKHERKWFSKAWKTT